MIDRVDLAMLGVAAVVAYFLHRCEGGDAQLEEGVVVGAESLRVVDVDFS